MQHSTDPKSMLGASSLEAMGLCQCHSNSRLMNADRVRPSSVAALIHACLVRYLLRRWTYTRHRPVNEPTKRVNPIYRRTVPLRSPIHLKYMILARLVVFRLCIQQVKNNNGTEHAFEGLSVDISSSHYVNCGIPGNLLGSFPHYITAQRGPATIHPMRFKRRKSRKRQMRIRKTRKRDRASSSGECRWRQ
jgi:hypothetical protein